MANANGNILLLSICIPTRGRKDILKTTLTSIFNSNVGQSDFEVVIYDSSEDSSLGDLLAANYPYPNLIYKRGENNGFLNLVHALEMGSGLFLKLHNDYSELCEGSLQHMLDIVQSNQDKLSVLFFTNDSLKNTTIQEYSTFDNFISNTSYYSSWATAFGIWKYDFDKAKSVNIEPMFPHTSLLFALSDKKNYIIDNTKLFKNHDVNTKGGYNLFETFCIKYLGMLNDCLSKQLISDKTFYKVKMELFEEFLVDWYCNTKILPNHYTFDLSGIESSMKFYYPKSYYYKMILLAYLRVCGKIIARPFKLFYLEKNK